MNIPVWRALLQDYEDSVICDFLEFGWPLGYTNQTLSVFDLRTHRGALDFPSAVQDYIGNEILLGRVVGPFDAPPFPDGFVVSPLNTVAKRDSQERRVIVDLSWPCGSSVNDAEQEEEEEGEEKEQEQGEESALKQILSACSQEALVKFNAFLDESVINSLKKLGEGAYGEVFTVEFRDGRSAVLKIIPVEGDIKVNDSRQKSFEEILPEIIISKYVSLQYLYLYINLSSLNNTSIILTK
ncbi:hypothetical protein ACROYT_G013238 [Oculina patagonica]